MAILTRRSTLAAFTGAAVLLTGCQGGQPAPAAKAEAHEHAAPETLAEAHHQLEELGGEIKSAFEAGEPEGAHDALHKIGEAIVALPKLAEEAGVEAKTEVEQVKSDLMDSYMQLDGVLHNKGEATWDDVREKIEAAMAKVKGWLPDDAGHAHEE